MLATKSFPYWPLYLIGRNQPPHVWRVIRTLVEEAKKEQKSKFDTAQCVFSLQAI